MKRASITLAALMIAGPAHAACFKDGEILTLRGVAIMETESGEGTSPHKAVILKLDTPICFDGDKETNEEYVEIIPKPNGAFPNRMTVTGRMVAGDGWTIDTENVKQIGGGCIEDVKRDALYIHATASCGTDYMDTKAGYDALAGARECKPSMTDRQFRKVARKAMLDFDAMAKRVGIHQACSAIDRIQKCMATGEGCGK
jgi:hypothetical protein